MKYIYKTNSICVLHVLLSRTRQSARTQGLLCCSQVFTDGKVVRSADRVSEPLWSAINLNCPFCRAQTLQERKEILAAALCGRPHLLFDQSRMKQSTYL